MGIINTRPVFIVGEVDFRIIRIDRAINFSWKETNICLRYPEVSFERPSTIEVNYEKDLTYGYYLIPDRQPPVYCNDGTHLRSKDKTRIVLLEGIYNKLTGKISGLSVVDAKIIDINDKGRYPRK